MSEYRLKISVFEGTGSVLPKIQVQVVVATNRFSCRKTRMIDRSSNKV